MRAIRFSKDKYIYFVESTSLKIGQVDKEQYVLYNGMRRDFKLGCVKYCSDNLSSDYLIELEWNYGESDVSLDIYIPQKSLIVGAVNEDVIYQGSKYNINIDYSENITLRLKRKKRKRYDKIVISPIEDIDIDKKDSDLESNIVGSYKDKKTKQTGAEELDEIDNLRNILDKSDNAVYIGRGAGREVYNISDCNIRSLHKQDGDIIKVAISEDSIEDNRRELQTWQTVKGTELEQYFCPITNFGSNHRYIVMEKAQVFDEFDTTKIGDDLFDRWVKWSDELDDKISKNTSLPTRDISYDNIGIYNGRQVLVDYPFGADIEM